MDNSTFEKSFTFDSILSYLNTGLPVGERKQIQILFNKT